MTKRKLYAVLDKSNRITGLTDDEIIAQRIKDQYGKIVRVKKDLADKLEEIPMDKEIVPLYDYYMTQEEEQEVIDLANDGLNDFMDVIDLFETLLKFLKFPNEKTRYELEELYKFLSDRQEMLSYGLEDTFHVNLIGDKLAQIRYRDRTYHRKQ